MAEALGDVKRGSYGVIDLFVEQRKYDKDKSKFFIWRERGHAAFVHALITKLNKVAVSDPEPKHYEDGYRLYTFTVNGATAGGHTSITLDSGQALNLQANDLLAVEGIYIASATPGGAPTAWTATRSVTAASREVIEVLSVDTATDTIIVRRGVGTTGAGAIQIPDNAVLYHNGESSEDGSGSRTSFSQNPVVVNNYVQIFKVPYEITELTQKVDIFGENEWQRKARNARKDFARRLDRGFQNGRMDRKQGDGGKYHWYTGGIDEWIPNDADHRINAARPLSSTYFNTVCKGAFMTGSDVKYGLCGYGFITLLANSAADKLRYNQAMSDDLGFDVHTFTASGGGKLHLIPDYEMSGTGKDNEIYFLDIAYIQYMYMQGMDIFIDSGLTGKGLQDNDQDLVKHQIKGVIGLKRTFKDAHFMLYGLT
jgi:hypothetical protein